MKKVNLLTIILLLSFSAIFAQDKIDENSVITVKTTVNNAVKPSIDQTHAPSSINSTTDVATYDFTTSASQYYGGSAGAAILEINGADTTWGMVAGDANASGSINTTDYLVVKPDVGSTGYYNTDVNLSGSVNTTDYLRIKPNVGKVTQVP